MQIVSQAKERLVSHRQFLTYAVIGVSGVTLDLVIFLILYNLLGFDKNIANFISVSAGILNNFVWNTKFNFQKYDKLHLRFASFYSVGLFGYLLSTIILFIGNDALGIDANIIKIISIPIVVITQYNLNRKISFQDYG